MTKIEIAYVKTPTSLNVREIKRNGAVVRFNDCMIDEQTKIKKALLKDDTVSHITREKRVTIEYVDVEVEAEALTDFIYNSDCGNGEIKLKIPPLDWAKKNKQISDDGIIEYNTLGLLPKYIGNDGMKYFILADTLSDLQKLKGAKIKLKIKKSPQNIWENDREFLNYRG